MTVHRFRIDQRSCTVADRRYRLTGVSEFSDERDRLRNHSEFVGIHHASRKEQRVKILGLGLLEGKVDGDLAPPFLHVPTFNLAFGR